MRTSVLLSVLIFSTPALLAPIWIKNGGGMSEFYLVSARGSAATLLELCESVIECAKGSANELKQLAKSEAISSELTFVTSKQIGDAKFRTEGPGSEILINQDLIATSFDLGDALEFLMQAWSQQMRLDSKKMTALATRAAALARTLILRSYANDFHISNLALVRFNYNSRVLVIEDHSQSSAAQNFYVPFSSKLDCRDANGMRDAIKVEQVPMAGWGAFMKKEDQAQVFVLGQIRYSCGSERFKARMRLIIPLKEADGALHADPESVEVTQDQIEAE